jgi:hypothetical protein
MTGHRVGHAGDGVTTGSSLWMDAPGHELALRALFGTSAWLARDAPARAVEGRAVRGTGPVRVRMSSAWSGPGLLRR